MIIKSLSRKAGGTGQLFKYLFRYMLDEEKRQLMPEPLAVVASRAKDYKSSKEFEEALREENLLQYHGTSIDFSGDPNTQSDNYGILGNGFYLAKQATLAKKHAQHTGTVKKYVIDNKAKFFDAGKGHTEYLKLWERISGQSKAFTSLTEVHDKIRVYLEREGYAGIRTSKQTVVFDQKTLAELPKDFFKQSRNAAKNHSADLELKQPQFVVRHNIRSRSVPGYIKEFERNEALRIHKRKDNVQVYHTILSFSSKDKAEVNDAILKDMAKKYIELRGKDNLYVITAHYDKDHLHLHCAMSGTKLNGLSSRVSRQKFAEIKVALDSYQKERYPNLIHSLPRHGRGKQIKEREENKNIKRDERTTERTSMMQVLDETFSKATSQQHFLTELTTLGHVPYFRTGKLTGIKYNGERKFRLNRLGFDEQKLLELTQRSNDEKALRELSELRKSRNSRQRVVQTLEDRIKGLDENEKRNELQAAVNNRKANEIGNTVPDTASLNDKDTQALRDLQSIRENCEKGSERDAIDDLEKDKVGDAGEPNQRDNKPTINDEDSENDRHDADKKSENDIDDGDDDDPQV